MSIWVGSAGDIAGVSVEGSQEAEYAAKVLATNPIAYWIQGEHEGSIAYCQVNPSQNGTYTAVTLGNAGIGDGQVCPFYDGTGSHTNVLTATLASAFDGSEGTVAIWIKAANAGVWADASLREAIRILIDGSNLVVLRKDVGANAFGFYYFAGGVSEIVSATPGPSTSWMHVAMTWSSTADEVEAFIDGAQTGLTQTGLGAWAGSIVQFMIGSDNGVASFWSGNLAHCAVWDSALAPATIATLATV